MMVRSSSSSFGRQPRCLLLSAACPRNSSNASYSSATRATLQTFSRTCRSAYQLAYQDDDQYLWRELFLSRPFDDLRKTVPPLIPSKPLEQHDWRSELQRRVEAEIVVGREELAGDPRLPRALETLVSIVETALPISDGPESDTSESLQWLDPLLNKLTKLDANSVTVPERKLLARLMAYVVLSYERSSDDSLGDEATKRRLRELRKHSRCYVYDLRRCKPETYYGPYTPGADGEIVANWEHVMHVVNVVALKLWELPMLALRLYCKPPAGLSSTQTYSAPFSHDRKPYDWAGVEGTWRRFVCFMDYRITFRGTATQNTLTTSTRGPSVRLSCTLR
ncbi:hypothetical protein WOLCODRAFT_139431 [Wolfiporia cocos MD-104 SS10]|uniref:Uncharacterized protein n=1 Tax=Wolfiporia cocos (strain MD-104) TaxID=742152 RepID=A0A2H3IX84_WOLCO|nr:hypothetical protein WOLCODRAFT_139431 [Wolfiporia cocos MD-104 SS10]